MIIDFHAHVYPQKVADKVLPAAKRKLKVEVPGTGSPQDLRDRMITAGIDHTVLLPLAKGTKDVASVNDWTYSIVKDGMIPFGSIHPKMDDLDSELDRLTKLGCKGVKMMPLLQEVYPDDPACFKLYESLIDLDMILITHAGRDPLDREEVYGTPDRFARVVESFPELKLVLAHLGGLGMYDEVSRYLIPAGGNNVYFDTAYVSFYLDPHQMIELIEEIGTKRVIFGTDYPWEDPKRALTILKKLDISNIDDVIGGNSARLLGL